MIEAALSGEGFRLVIRVSGYEHPALETGSDANWLSAEVELTARGEGSFSARRAVALRTEEIAAFHDQLARLVEALDGEATLDHLEDEVGCTITLTRGKGEFSGFVRQHLGAELQVTGLPIDQTYLREALGAFARIAAEFPVKGDAFA